MQIAATAPVSQERVAPAKLIPVARIEIPRAFDQRAVAYGRLGREGGYASVTNAVKALTQLTAGEAPAAAVLHEGGRFYGYNLFERKHWLYEAKDSYYGLHSDVEPLHLTHDSKLHFGNDAVAAVVDGDVVLRP